MSRHSTRRTGTANRWAVAVLMLAYSLGTLHAGPIDSVWDGTFYDADTHYYVRRTVRSSIQLSEGSGCNQCSLREVYMAVEFPIDGLTPGARTLRLTLAEKPLDNWNRNARIDTHELSFRIKPGDGTVTFADFFNITPDVDAPGTIGRLPCQVRPAKGGLPGDLHRAAQVRHHRIPARRSRSRHHLRNSPRTVQRRTERPDPARAHPRHNPDPVRQPGHHTHRDAQQHPLQPRPNR